MLPSARSDAAPATVAADKPRADFRPEIQALRALAIVSVVAYHLWPGGLTGGYLGVDIFFVISGFLITSHLLRDSAGGRLSLPRFWARRIRRLLPASLAVLLVTAVAVIAVVPQRLWQQYLSEVIASTVYAQNWFLAASSVDYLSADNDPSPVQHFWSLSAEEQFYIVWPIVIALALLGWRLRARRASTLEGGEPAGQPRRLLFGILLVITLASLAWAIYSTATNPAPAFFATTTRAWEFGAGSLLAFVPATWLHGRLPLALRNLLAWVGWLSLAACVVLFTSATPHPSYPTIIPVLGTLLVIWAGASPSRWSPTPMTRFRPVRFVGDISYSWYLWHWPLIVLVPFVTGHALGPWDVAVIIVVTLVLAWATWRLIERPALRLPLTPRGSTRRWFVAALIGAVVLTAIPVSGLVVRAQAAAHDRALAAEAADANSACLGAASLANPVGCAAVLEGLPLVPSPAIAVDDNYSRSGCTAQPAVGDWDPCAYVGGDGSGIRVAVVGDSHAGQAASWVDRLADEHNMTVFLFAPGGCPFEDAAPVDTPAAEAECVERNARVLTFLEDNPVDLVVTTQASGAATEARAGMTAEETATAAVASMWDSVLATGARILAVKDNPRPIGKVQTCLEANWPQNPSACDNTAETGFRFDPTAEAAAEFAGNPDVALLDLDEYFCSDGVCPAVIGGTNVYRDNNHVTATYLKSMYPYIRALVDPALLTAH